MIRIRTKRRRTITIVLSLIVVAGIALLVWQRRGLLGWGDVWSDFVKVPLLDRFQGRWQFDMEQTLAVWQANGKTPEDIARTRDYYAETAKLTEDEARQLRAQGIDPRQVEAALGRLHPDMTLHGHIAICDGLPSAEYRFFALHQHDGKVCGKAWHHEDRFDPGDMSKCYVRLGLVGSELHFELRMMDESASLNDPDLFGAPGVTAGRNASCDADSLDPNEWSDWVTYVFVRP